jgi:hypothetical protein
MAGDMPPPHRLFTLLHNGGPGKMAILHFVSTELQHGRKFREMCCHFPEWQHGNTFHGVIWAAIPSKEFPLH